MNCVSPLQVHSGDVEDDPFEPEDHEEALRKRAIPDALPITPGLQNTQHCEPLLYNTALTLSLSDHGLY